MELLGLSPRDFSRAIRLALDKMTYPDLGFSFEEADLMTTFNGTLPEILDTAIYSCCPIVPSCLNVSIAPRTAVSSAEGVPSERPLPWPRERTSRS